jgi:Phage tail lysozyme
VSSATVGGRKPVSAGGRHRAGRHQAPHRPQKARVARSAAIALPALAVLGTLAAIPQVRDVVTDSPAAARHAASADVVSRAQAPNANDAATAARDETQSAQNAKTAHAIAVVRRAVASAQKADAAAKARQEALHPAPPVCSGTAGLLPQNVQTIVVFLVAHGYSANGAAGLAGNIYQESGGDPESGGGGAGGLIGWTPLPAGYVTGSTARDLQTQLNGILSFNDQFAGDLPALNDASSPAAAADVYVTDFEHASNPVAGTRESSAEAVAVACHL